jgi:phosphate transport system protein
MISPHTVKAFDAELLEVTSLLIETGRLAGAGIRDSVAALVRLDADTARRVVAGDHAIDRLQREIEGRALVLIARRQPMAVDLRQIVGALRIANDLERIGDLAKNIAKRAISLGSRCRVRTPTDAIAGMAARVVTQLDFALNGFIRRDRASALEAWRRDQEIDAQHRALSEDLLEGMSEECADLALGIHYLFCTKNLEHMGDHAANIAKTVFYVIEGQALGEGRLETSTAPREDTDALATPTASRNYAAATLIVGEGQSASQRRDLAPTSVGAHTGSSDR